MMAAFAIMGQLGDLVATYVGVAVFGAPEGNPIAVWAMSMFGIAGGLAALKTATILLCIPATRGGRAVLGVVGLIGAATWLPVFVGLVPDAVK